MAEQIKQMVTMDVAARHYGFDIGRGGFMRCPFHQGDRTASLKIYSGGGGWHCFGCNKGGSVVDFVMELFGLNFKQALLRLNADFNLGLSSARPDRAAYSEMLERRQAEQREPPQLAVHIQNHTGNLLAGHRLVKRPGAVEKALGQSQYDVYHKVIKQ